MSQLHLSRTRLAPRLIRVLRVSSPDLQRVRYRELSRRIAGVTPKMLTQTLRVLERDGLVEREIYPEVPPRVEYRLTRLGGELVGLLDAILRCSERHVPEILKARAAARARQPQATRGSASPAP